MKVSSAKKRKPTYISGVGAKLVDLEVALKALRSAQGAHHIQLSISPRTGGRYLITSSKFGPHKNKNNFDEKPLTAVYQTSKTGKLVNRSAKDSGFSRAAAALRDEQSSETIESIKKNLENNLQRNKEFYATLFKGIIG